jgi:hypothetical protein
MSERGFEKSVLDLTNRIPGLQNRFQVLKIAIMFCENRFMVLKIAIQILRKLVLVLMK